MGEMQKDAARVVEARMDGAQAEGVRAGGRAAELDALAEKVVYTGRIVLPDPDIYIGWKREKNAQPL